jgi:hypothetical protein
VFFLNEENELLLLIIIIIIIIITIIFDLVLCLWYYYLHYPNSPRQETPNLPYFEPDEISFYTISRILENEYGAPCCVCLPLCPRQLSNA